MILQHEIPSGSRLYFGNSAKLKREIENKICNLLLCKDFEEIVVPNFSYHQYESISNSKKLIRINDEQNNMMSLKADSTLDVVRIINKRLGRTTKHKKWFYAQPVFTYPSNEDYQIGCEQIDCSDFEGTLKLAVECFKALQITPLLQVSNIAIAQKISIELDIDYELFIKGEISALLELKVDWLTNLINAKNIEELGDISNYPKIIQNDISKLIDVVKSVDYDNIVISPLYQSSLKYHKDIYFRAILENKTILKGGSYKSDDIDSLGFALYVDNVIKILEN
jgi:histidyl-tRNA synthetase